MSSNSITNQQLGQAESREPEVQETEVQRVDEQAVVQAGGVGRSEGPETAGLSMKVDPGTFKVMRGRKIIRPSKAKVTALVEAIKRGDTIPPIIVYQDRKTAERFAPDGGHRQAAYQELGRPVPIMRIDVDNAQERAEEESCRANNGNGRERSRGDQKFQLEKACDLLSKKHGKPPKPSDLAKLTAVDHTTCSLFLREFLAPKAEELPVVEDDNEQRQFTGKLEKVRDALRAVKPKEGWVAGNGMLDMLAEVEDEVRRIKKYKVRRVAVTPEEIEKFMNDNTLTMEQIGRLVGVKHTAVSRWLKRKTKMTPHNQRAVHQMLALTSEQVQSILEQNNG